MIIDFDRFLYSAIDFINKLINELKWMAMVLIHSLSIKLFKCLMLVLYVIVKKKYKKKKTVHM